MSDSKDTHDFEDIGCLEAIESLHAWLDGELDATSVQGLEQHLGHCRSCFSRAEMERALTRRLRQTTGTQVPDHLRARLRKLLDEF